MARNRTRITVDGTVVEQLKDGVRIVTDYDTEIEALNAAKTLIEAEIAEQGNSWLLHIAQMPLINEWFSGGLVTL